MRTGASSQNAIRELDAERFTSTAAVNLPIRSTGFDDSSVVNHPGESRGWATTVHPFARHALNVYARAACSVVCVG